MPDVLKSSGTRITTASGSAFEDTLVTVGSGKTLTITSISISNITTSTVDVSVTAQKSGSGTAFNLIGTDTPIGQGQSLYFPHKHVLEATDVLKCKCSADDSVDVFFSYLEQS